MSTTTPRKLGWKVYFGLSCILTLLGVPMQPLAWVDGLGLLVSLASLVGLFGYAWSMELPGSGRVWRGIAFTAVVWLLVSIAVMVFRANSSGAHPSLLTIALAVAIILAVFAPTAVALFRYADWKLGRSAGVA